MTSDTALPVELDAARVVIDAWCERYANGMPPATARDQLISDIFNTRALSATRTAVKPLEWEEVNGAAGVWWRAGTPLGGLQLEAMSIAERERKEADYKLRILSALSTTEDE